MKNLEMVLDFMVELKTDKSKVQKLADETEKLLSTIQPDIDTSSLKKGVQEIMNYLQSSGGSVENLKQAMSSMEINLDADDLVNTFNQIENALLEIDKIDISETLNKIDLSNIESTLQKLDSSLSSMSDEDFFQEIESLADSFSRTEKEAKSLLETQKKALQAMKASGKEGSESYNKLENEIIKTESKLKDLNVAFNGINESAKGIESATDILSKFTAFADAGEVLSKFTDSAIESREAMLNLQGRTGATGDELARLKTMAEDAFKRGVGGSVAEAINAVGTAQQTLGNFLNPDQLLAFTKASAGIAQVFDKDINEVLLSSRTFISQFGLEGQEAANLLGLAMQKSGSKMDDTLDTIDEYSQLVKLAGFNALEFIGVINTGMELGARDTDKLADAIKETQIRINAGDYKKPFEDMIEASTGAEKAIQENIQSILDQAASNEISVKDALQLSTSVIKEAFDAGEINAAMRDQLNVAISGTMAEDIGGELFTKIFSTKIDTSQVTAQAQKAGEDIANALGPVTILEKVQKQFELYSTKLGEMFTPFIAGAGEALQSVSQIAPALSLLGDFDIKKFQNLGTLILGLIPGFTSVGAIGSASGTAVSAAWIPVVAPIAAIALGLAGLYLFFTKTEKGAEIANKIGDGFKKLWESAKPAFEGFENYGKSVVNALTTIGEAVWEWLIAPFEFGAEIMDMILGVIGNLIGETLDLSSVFKAMGEVYNQAAKKVDAVTQVFANVVKWIKETKNEIIAFIRNAPELFGILFDYAQYYLNPANWISGDDEFEKKLAKRMQDALKKVSDTAKELSSQKEIKKTEESIQKVNEKQKDLNKTTKVGNDLNNEKNKNSKTALELVKEEAGLKAKILELEYQKTDYFVKQKQLDENRNATSEEELYLLNEQIRTIEKQKLAWLDTLKAKKLIKEITPKGEIVFQPKVKNADKVEIETLINNFNKELQNNQSKMQGLKLKINTDELELDKSIKELQKQKIEWEVSVGIKDEGALKIYTDEFQSELNLARNQIKQYEAGTLKISKENYANLLKKELEYSQKVLENQDRMYESKKKKIDSQYETELEKLKLKYSKEEEFLKIASDKILSNDTSKIENTKINALDDLKQKEDEKFKTLDRLRENDSISESNYEKRKLELQQKFNQEREKIESDSRKEKLQSEALLNGTSIELQRRKDEEILNLEKSKLKDEILLLEERAIIFDTLGQPIFETEKDKEAYNNLKSKLEDTEELLKSKADTISLVLTGLQETATESLMNLFTGDIDAIVDSWREYFNQLAGMLQAKASAFALDLILTPGTIQYLSALPFPLNVAAIPAITQAVNIAVKTISDPLIKPILSFPTGAKFESPTLAIVGDGAKLGMPNREWLFNDPQLIGIIQMASLSSNALIIKRLEMIDENLSKRNLTTKLKGKDIEISYNRTYQRTNARAR